MKYVLILILPIVALSCNEELILPEREYVRDTVTVIKEVTRVDTVTNTVRDTVITTTPPTACGDSIIDTQYDIHQDYAYLVQRFYAEADSLYGWHDLQQNNLIVTKWLIADIQANGYPPGYTGNGISIAYKEENVQWYAKINEIVDTDRAFLPLYRELAHILLNKPYAPLDADDIMSPNFSKQYTERPYDEPNVRPYLDKLFEH